jgi:hypothetical protein
MLALWVKVRVKPEERDRFLEAIEADALGSERMSQAACASTFFTTGRTRTSTTSSTFTGTRLRWRRTGPHPTTPSGAPPPTHSTAHPRRRVAILYFLRRPGIRLSVDLPAKACRGHQQVVMLRNPISLVSSTDHWP